METPQSNEVHCVGGVFSVRRSDAHTFLCECFTGGVCKLIDKTRTSTVDATTISRVAEQTHETERLHPYRANDCGSDHWNTDGSCDIGVSELCGQNAGE
jgi:hypothetical protein